MNFFERQDHARQQTRRLVILFCLTVAAMTGGIYLAAVMFLGGGGGRCLRADLPERNVTTAATLSTTAGLTPAMTLQGEVIQPLEIRRRGRGRGGSNFNSRRRTSPFGYRSRRSRRSNGNCSPVESLLSRWWNPGLFLLVSGTTLGVIAFGSLTKIAQLSAGGKVVAEELGGKLLLPETADPQERQLLNVVEEMAIAAGMPVPPVYLLDQESGINAFAAGFRPQDAVLGMTRGSLEQLSRDELQGVVGHEFSHILNGDMRLNIRLMGVLNGILFVYIAGRMLMYSGSSSDEEGNSLGLFGLALVGLGGIGLLGGRLIQSAASRQREFLADASAVQFTRNPDGIAGALEKIGQFSSRVASPKSETASHLFFGNVLSGLWSGDWFATHPPLAERIARVRGVPLAAVQSQAAMVSTSELTQTSAMGTTNDVAMAGFAGKHRSRPSVTSTPPPASQLTPDQVVEQVGRVTPAHYNHTRALLSLIPDNLREQIRHPQAAIATLYALFLDPAAGRVQEQQLQTLQASEPQAIWAMVLEQCAIIQTLDPRLRLPLVDLTVPALRQCSPEILQRVLATLARLAEADDHWSLFEFLQLLVLQRRLEDYLGDSSGHKSVGKQRLHQSLGPLWSDCLLILSALASAGVPSDTPNPEQVAFIFHHGVLKLPGAAPERIPKVPPSWTQAELKQSLEHLRNLTPKLQQAVINACAHAVLLDNNVTLAEAELLRAVTIALDCPMPPFLVTEKA
jgi:Zn-dependent protease with chaperone function